MNKITKLTLALSIVLLALASLSLLLPRKNNKNEANRTGGKNTEPGDFVQNFKQKIGCTDIRDVFYSSDTAYISCDGGIIIFNTKNKTVEKYITMSNGLSNRYINSIVEYKQKLYAGTQEGITEYDLKTFKTRDIGMNEGLSNNSNVKLILDGDYLWAYTFNGLNRIDLKTFKIDVYKNELDPNAKEWSVISVFATRNYVYAVVSANINSQGSIARFNKSNMTWEYFLPKDFEKTDQYARIDFFDFIEVDKYVYAAGFLNKYDLKNSLKTALEKNEIWKIKNEPGSKFEKVSSEEFDKLFSEYSNNFKNKEIDLNLPIYTKILSIINNKAYLKSYTKDYKFVISEVDLEKLDSILFYPNQNSTNNDNAETEYHFFEPIENTKDIVIAGQQCGMVCTNVYISVLNYQDKSSITPDYKQLVPENKGNSFGSQIILTNYSPVDNYFTFYDYSKGAKKLTYKFTQDKSKIEMVSSIEAKSEDSSLRVNCTNFFEFDSVFKSLEKENCFGNFQSSGISISEDTENITVGYKNKNYTVKMSKKPYSPFEDWIENITPYKAVIDGQVLWISTNRGLAYINTENGNTTLYDVSDGLISPEVQDFTIYKNKLITIYNGISVIDL